MALWMVKSLTGGHIHCQGPVTPVPEIASKGAGTQGAGGLSC